METKENENLILSHSFNEDENNRYQLEPNNYKYKSLSMISWISLVFFSWKSFSEQNTTYFILEILNEGRLSDYNYDEQYYYKKGDEIAFPLFIKLSMLHTFITVLIIMGFINYVIYTMIKPSQLVDEGLFGKVSKFHFLPLSLVSAIFFFIENIQIIKKERKYDDNYHLYYEYNKNHITMNRLNFILIFFFTVTGFISLFIVYIKSKFSSNKIAILTIKKGVYSSLLVLLFHNIFNSIIAFKYIDIIEDNVDIEIKLADFFRFSRIVFGPILGVGIIIFSFIFKDVIALFTNFLMFIGMLISLKTTNVGGDDEGIKEEIIIDSCMIFSSFVGFFLFAIKKLDKKLFK